MPEDVNKNDAVSKFVPGIRGFGDLAKAGAYMSLGLVGARFIGAAANTYMPPVPIVGKFLSNETIASAVSTTAMYAAMRHADKHPRIQEVLFYGAAGSAAHTAGSLFFDVANAFGIGVPTPIATAVGLATAASPVSVQMEAKQPGQGEPDLNTKFGA